MLPAYRLLEDRDNIQNTDLSSKAIVDALPDTLADVKT